MSADGAGPQHPFERQLWALSEAAVAINSPRTVGDLLAAVAEQARRVIGTHLAAASLTVEGTGAAEGWPQRNLAVSASDRYAAEVAPVVVSPSYDLVCAGTGTVRRTDEQLDDHPFRRGVGSGGHRRLGWLAAPMVASDGRNLGILQLADREQGAFTATDEAILQQLAQLASLALEKTRLLTQRDRQAEQLRGLARAAVAISSPSGLQETLDRITEVAADLVGAHQAVTSLTVGGDWSQAIQSVHLSDRYAAWRDYDVPPDGSGIYAVVTERNEPVRLTQQELEQHPRWRGFGEHAAEHPPMRGWLAVPLTSAAGENLGLLQLSDRAEGEFTEEDERLLVQLAQLASVAIQNAQLQSELLHRQRQQLTQDLLAGLSHDMQTPLAMILALTPMVGGADAPPEQQEAGELLRTQAERLHRLIQQFLDYVRLQSDELLVLRPRAIDVAAQVERVARQVRAERYVEVELPAALPPALADPDRVGQVLDNLVGNAIKFSAAAVRVVVREDGAGVAIDVIDRGPGISASDREVIFEKLHRGADARRSGIPGHGLGLYVSRELAAAMGGRLEVTSEVGVGSTFTLWLPTA